MSYMEEFELSDDYLYAIKIVKDGSVYDKAAGELWRSYHVVLKFFVWTSVVSFSST